MAVYDLTVAIPSYSSLRVGDILNYSPGDVGGFVVPVLPRGKYKLECWAAQGHTDSSYPYGKGGYSCGIYSSSTRSNLYLNVGCRAIEGYLNGAGKSYYDGAVRYAGGACHIATVQGQLSSLNNNRSAILLVAGGGGSSCYGCRNYTELVPEKGYGGGISGGDGSDNYSTQDDYGRGGTQSSGGSSGEFTYDSTVPNEGSFGQGGSYIKGTYTGCGGGGGFYGGGSGGGMAPYDINHNGCGGGGSGYVSSVLTEASTIAGNQTFPSYAGGTELGHQGSGCIRITILELPYLFNVKVNNTWKKGNGYCKVGNQWKRIEKVFVKVNGVWKNTQ